MNSIVVSIILFIVSFFWALKALRDVDVPAKVRKAVWGIILFVGNRVIHYHSSSLDSSDPSSSSRSKSLRTKG